MYNIYFLIILIILILVILKKLYKLKIENFNNKSDVPNMQRPFVNIYDNFGNKLNVILISKPFSTDEHYKTYLDNKDKNIFLGITSYLEFPNNVSNPYEDFTENYKKYKYKDICQGWLHCFRNPENYIPNHIPRELISESDFCDCSIIKPMKNIEKKYDFIYICLKQNEKLDKCDDWATYNKNWTLAKKCLSIMCKKFKLKGLLVGRKDCEIDGACNNLITTTNMLKYNDLMKAYQESKFIFLPNVADASPRVLTEAFCSNIPCLINRNILGGWKYINDKNGEFFESTNDIEIAIEKLLNKIKNNEYEPRKYFIENYGIINSGKNLKKFIYKNYSDKVNIPEREVSYLTIAYSKENFTGCMVGI